MPQSQKPQLPAQFVKDLLARPTFSAITSTVFNADFHEQRFKMMTGSNPTQSSLSADHIVCLEDGSLGMGPGSNRTYLQLGSLVGDPLLVCEMIRIGATIDIKDAHGATALWLAADSLFKTMDVTRRNRARKMKGPKLPDPTERIVFAIRTLIEQHADVNIVHKGSTPFYSACKAQHWDTITLMLAHGANPAVPATSQAARLFTNSDDRKRFESLVERFAGKPRPARPCPCWSGKFLSKCHDAEEKPYPPEFICRCGSGKTYAKCCARRKGMSLIEKWDEENDWIMPVTVKTLPAEMGGDSLANAIRILAEARAGGAELPGKQALLGFQGRLADMLAERGQIDVAYGYAMKQVDFNPRCVYFDVNPNLKCLIQARCIIVGLQVVRRAKGAVLNFKKNGTRPLTSTLLSPLTLDLPRRWNGLQR